MADADFAECTEEAAARDRSWAVYRELLALLRQRMPPEEVRAAQQLISDHAAAIGQIVYHRTAYLCREVGKVVYASNKKRDELQARQYASVAGKCAGTILADRNYCPNLPTPENLS